MPSQFQSKTILGLLVLLLVAVGLDVAHLLTEQAVEVLKWVGASFMAVRGIANLPGNSP